jgi:DNA repair photolyase
MGVTREHALRWRLAEEEDGGQQRLFEEPTGWRAGHGEFRGLEFLEVRAKRIINEVPASSKVPFRYTINAYRGCSHACSYCAGGDTPILMGDGRTKPLAEIQVGDAVYGTVREGNYRRSVTTPVLDHWSTVKPAYRITLEDGTELVASGDHRFLTDRGWKHVSESEQDWTQRPHLMVASRLLVVDHVTRRRSIEGMALSPDASLTVESIEALGRELPLYDITTGTGDFIANGVVSHNCFARPTHEYLNLNAGEDFERKIVVKINAVERARAEVAAPSWGGELIAMGTNTDPYQRCEGKYRLTRGIIEVLGAAGNPFSILTKSTLIVRDLDVLAAAARRTEVRAALSVGTLDEDVWRASEPGTPHPRRRLEAVSRLNAAGIPTGVLAAPILPGLSDSPEQLEALARACAEAGATHVTPIVLHLRPGVREQYMPWLEACRPDLGPLYERLYTRSYAPKGYQEEVTSRFHAALDSP